MPENTHIVMNAAHALLVHMQVHGMQADKQAKVADYLQRVRARDPSHPKYLEVLALERQVNVRQTEEAA
jgi:hypothetical protein